MLAAVAGGRPSEVAQRPRLSEVPFDSSAKYMATFHDAGDFIDIYIKGAPDVLLTHCASTAAGDGTCAPLDPAGRNMVLTTNEALGERGLRVLALASRRIAHSDWPRRQTPAPTSNSCVSKGSWVRRTHPAPKPGWRSNDAGAPGSRRR